LCIFNDLVNVTPTLYATTTKSVSTSKHDENPSAEFLFQFLKHEVMPGRAGYYNQSSSDGKIICASVAAINFFLLLDPMPRLSL